MRRELNHALHEARRPLQAICLAGGGGAEAAQLAAALERIAALVNGAEPARTSVEPTAIGRLLADAVVRFTPLLDRGRSIHLIDVTAGAELNLDRAAALRAIDNILTNALEHGHGPVEIVGIAEDEGVKVVCRNKSYAHPHGESTWERGHGLEITHRAAHRNGGQFAFDRDEETAIAVLKLSEPAVSAA